MDRDIHPARWAGLRNGGPLGLESDLAPGVSNPCGGRGGPPMNPPTALACWRVGLRADRGVGHRFTFNQSGP